MKKEIVFAIALMLGSRLLPGSALATTDEAFDAARQSAMWDQADVNRDGYVSKDEASAIDPKTNEEMNFMASDKNSDGRVSKDEYAAGHAAPRASDGSIITERGAAGPSGPESEHRK